MAASGASKSQLYHYFADKDALVLDVSALQTERVLGVAAAAARSARFAAMRRWRDAVLALNRRTGCPLGALVYQLPRSARGARTAVGDGLEIWRRRIEEGLVRMQARGELAPGAPRPPTSRSRFSAPCRAACCCRAAPSRPAARARLRHGARPCRRAGSAPRGPLAGRSAAFAIGLRTRRQFPEGSHDAGRIDRPRKPP